MNLRDKIIQWIIKEKNMTIEAATIYYKKVRYDITSSGIILRDGGDKYEFRVGDDELILLSKYK